MAVISFNQNTKGEHESITIKGNEEEIEKTIDYVRHMYDEPSVCGDKDKKSKDVDMVNTPPHYTEHGMECIDEMILVFGKEAVMNFCLCNCWKYRYRAPYKGDTEENMEKSRWYLNKYKELKNSSTITFNTIEQNDIKTLPLTTDKIGYQPFNNHITC